MPHNEEGEFELILGNKQLLSVFFLVVVLLGVFFAMGYVVGRNSGPVGAVETAANRPPAEGKSSPLVIEPADASPRPSAPVAESSANPVPPATTESTDIAVDPSPSRTVPSEAKPSSTAETPASTPGNSPTVEPTPGQTFLQVAAVRRSDAELLTEVLSKRGFAARIAAGPSESLFRVLVGPLPDVAAVSKTKAELEAIGFKSLRRTY